MCIKGLAGCRDDAIGKRLEGTVLAPAASPIAAAAREEAASWLALWASQVSLKPCGVDFEKVSSDLLLRLETAAEGFGAGSLRLLAALAPHSDLTAKHLSALVRMAASPHARMDILNPLLRRSVFANRELSSALLECASGALHSPVTAKGGFRCLSLLCAPAMCGKGDDELTAWRTAEALAAVNGTLHVSHRTLAVLFFLAASFVLTRPPLDRLQGISKVPDMRRLLASHVRHFLVLCKANSAAREWVQGSRGAKASAWLGSWLNDQDDDDDEDEDDDSDDEKHVSTVDLAAARLQWEDLNQGTGGADAWSRHEKEDSPRALIGHRLKLLCDGDPVNLSTPSPAPPSAVVGVDVVVEVVAFEASSGQHVLRGAGWVAHADLSCASWEVLLRQDQA